MTNSHSGQSSQDPLSNGKLSFRVSGRITTNEFVVSIRCTGGRPFCLDARRRYYSVYVLLGRITGIYHGIMYVWKSYIEV